MNIQDIDKIENYVIGAGVDSYNNQVSLSINLNPNFTPDYLIVNYLQFKNNGSADNTIKASLSLLSNDLISFTTIDATLCNPIVHKLDTFTNGTYTISFNDINNNLAIGLSGHIVFGLSLVKLKI